MKDPGREVDLHEGTGRGRCILTDLSEEQIPSPYYAQ